MTGTSVRQTEVTLFVSLGGGHFWLLFCGAVGG